MYIYNVKNLTNENNCSELIINNDRSIDFSCNDRNALKAMEMYRYSERWYARTRSILLERPSESKYGR